MTPKSNLTRYQHSVLSFIRRELSKGNPFPTAPVIGKRLGIEQGYVRAILTDLISHGRLEIAHVEPWGKSSRYTYRLAVAA